jgi:hypothetical protein
MTLLKKTDLRKTNDKGFFIVALTHYPTRALRFSLEVSKDGFKRYDELIPGCDRYEREITLHREKK